MAALLNANTPEGMTEAGRVLVQQIFGTDFVTEFACSVCDNWTAIEELPDIDATDRGVRYSNKLRKLVASTNGILQKLLASILVLSPQSMTTERVISNYNQVKSAHRMALQQDSINARLHVSLIMALEQRITAHALLSLNFCEKKTDDTENQTVKCIEREILLPSFLGTVAHYNLLSLCCRISYSRIV